MELKRGDKVVALFSASSRVFGELIGNDGNGIWTVKTKLKEPYKEMKCHESKIRKLKS